MYMASRFTYQRSFANISLVKATNRTSFEPRFGSNLNRTEPLSLGSEPNRTEPTPKIFELNRTEPTPTTIRTEPNQRQFEPFEPICCLGRNQPSQSTIPIRKTTPGVYPSLLNLGFKFKAAEFQLKANSAAQHQIFEPFEPPSLKLEPNRTTRFQQNSNRTEPLSNLPIY